MGLHPQFDWQRTVGQYVEIRLDGKTIRTGTVEAVMPDDSILWISAEGTQSREMVERVHGKQVFARYPWDAPPQREATGITPHHGEGHLLHAADRKQEGPEIARMLIIGPPGSGKGTQAERISRRLGIVAISTGDIFRASVKGETPLGLEAKQYIDAGDFVPDSVTNRIVRDRLSEDDIENGFLLDGYPRTSAQIDYLDRILASKGQRLDAVLELTADREELVARLLARALASGRSDDNEEVIRHRLDLYHEQTEAVVWEYAKLGILTKVDGIGTIDTVTDRLFHALSIRDTVPYRH